MNIANATTAQFLTVEQRILILGELQLLGNTEYVLEEETFYHPTGAIYLEDALVFSALSRIYLESNSTHTLFSGLFRRIFPLRG